MSDMTKSMILIFSDARATIASAPSSPWARYCNLSLQEFWEKKPLHMKRDDPEYYKTLFSTKALDKVILEEMSSKIIDFFFCQILREQRVVFGKNLDVTSYSDGKRETHNPGGRVTFIF